MKGAGLWQLHFTGIFSSSIKTKGKKILTMSNILNKKTKNPYIE